MENGKWIMTENNRGRGMSAERKNVVAEKSLSFAVRVVKLYQHLVDKKREFVMSKQVLRSGTSIGANIREATSAQSKADFIAKCCVALKECDETGYWRELLSLTNFLSKTQYESVETDRRELFALLTAIIKTAKASLKHS